MVTPYAGVWIEIVEKVWDDNNDQVTPYAGVWIEIKTVNIHITGSMVTPYAGVWIEINHIPRETIDIIVSLPTRECGLKFQKLIINQCQVLVTPYAGVWIEIFQ